AAEDHAGQTRRDPLGPQHLGGDQARASSSTGIGHGAPSAGLLLRQTLARSGQLRAYCGGAARGCALVSTPSSRAARRGQYGSRSSSRPSSTTSASPSATIFAAWAGSVIRPTAPV